MYVIKQDITEVKGPVVIAHGVNCQNTMGSGVAKALYTKWPIVKEGYHKFCDNLLSNNHTSKDLLGKVQYQSVDDDIMVFNCFTQEYYGKDGKRYADIQAIRESLTDVIKFMAFPFHYERFKDLYIPQIGCGLGGLDWEKELKPLLIDLEKKFPSVNITVCVI